MCGATCVVRVLGKEVSFSARSDKHNPDLEIEILHDLAQRVLGYDTLLATASDILGELDW